MSKYVTQKNDISKHRVRLGAPSTKPALCHPAQRTYSTYGQIPRISP